MAKQKKGKREIEAADYAILALPAQGRKLCGCELQEGAESEVRDKLDGKRTKGKKTRKLLQTGNRVSSSRKGNEKSNKHERSAENSSGHDIESGALSRSPDDNELLISFVRRVKGRKKENYAWSPSDDEVLSSWIRRQKRKNQEQMDYLRPPSDNDVLISMVRRQTRRNQEKIDKSIERNKETETSKKLCASRDEITGDDNMNLLSREGLLIGNLGKKLLVLDINGLLADIVSPAPRGYTTDTIINGRSVFKRPFCNDFLEFCFARFNVGVWSSRTSNNLESILDFLMGKAKHKLLFYWDQSYCTNSGFKTVEGKPLYVKKLKKLWRKQEYGLPWGFGEYNASNTLLLDDSPHKAVCNPPFTAVFPPSYKYSDKEDNSLGAGGDLRMYLEGLAVAENVQKYVQENPIGQEAITENHPKWCFYLKVIKACSSSQNSPVYEHWFRPWR